MKPTFFSSCLVLEPTSGDFSRDGSRFPRSTVYFLSHSPILNPISGDFFDGTSLFSAPNFNFSSLFPVLPILRALLREISPFIFATLPFLHSVKAFPIRVFPCFILCSTFLFSIDFLSAPQSPHPLHSLPHFPSHSSPLFHLPPQLTHERAHPRTLRAYAYARTNPHVRRFSFFSFTASPTFRNPLGTNALEVKENEKKPSQNTQQSHNQNISTKHPISSAVNFI